MTFEEALAAMRAGLTVQRPEGFAVKLLDGYLFVLLYTGWEAFWALDVDDILATDWEVV